MECGLSILEWGLDHGRCTSDELTWIDVLVKAPAKAVEYRATSNLTAQHTPTLQPSSLSCHPSKTYSTTTPTCPCRIIHQPRVELRRLVPLPHGKQPPAAAAARMCWTLLPHEHDQEYSPTLDPEERCSRRSKMARVAAMTTMTTAKVDSTWVD